MYYTGKGNGEENEKKSVNPPENLKEPFLSVISEFSLKFKF